MPEFTTVIWDCGSCGWSSEPDGFVGVADGDELASARRTRGPVEPEDPPDEAVAALTEHEIEVIRLVGAGLSNQAIADRLVISINTVKATLNKAYRKMRVSSRTQAQLWAIRHELFDPEA
jgi:DNA-binding NarL/FixJ family response regulator